MEKKQISQDDWKKILVQVYKQSAVDNKFRELCLKDPYTAVKQITGYEIPKDIKFRFIDQSKELSFILPAFKKGEELNESQLEALAAGSTITVLPTNLGPENLT